MIIIFSSRRTLRLSRQSPLATAEARNSAAAADTAATDTCRGLASTLSPHLICYHGIADHTTSPRTSARRLRPVACVCVACVCVCACPRLLPSCYRSAVRVCACDVLSVCVRDRLCSSRLPNLLRRVTHFNWTNLKNKIFNKTVYNIFYCIPLLHCLPLVTALVADNDKNPQKTVDAKSRASPSAVCAFSQFPVSSFSRCTPHIHPKWPPTVRRPLRIAT